MDKKEKKEKSRIIEDLKKTDKQIEKILNTMSELITLMDPDYKILWANKAAHASYEQATTKTEGIEGNYCYEIWTDDNKPCEKCPLIKALETGKVEEEEIVRTDGRKWLIKGYPIKDEQGNVTNLLEVVRDITKKNKLEQALRDSEQLYKILVDTAPYAVTVTDLKGEVTFTSDRALEIYGYETLEEVLGKSAFIFIAPFDRKRAKANMKKTLEKGIVRNLEYTLLRKDGSSFIGEMNASLIKDDKGQPQAFVAITRDITERKENEKKLKEKEAYNFALFNYSPVETIVVDRKGRVTKSNLAKRRSGDRIPEIGNIMYKDYGARHEKNMYAELMKCIKTGKNKEFPQMKYEDKYLSISIAPFSEGAIIISQDITKRIKAEKALKQNEQRFRLIVETMPSLLVITDKEGKNLYVSPNCEEITGYSKKELENNFIWWVHEDDLGRAKKVFDKSYKEHTDGRNFEYKAVKKDGKIWYASSAWEPIIDEKGTFQGMILQTIDISDKKIMEQEIAKAQKLESIGILAGGIAHDFNNFLTGIIGNISLAKLKTDPKDEIFEILTESEKAAHSAKSLTQQLLTFSKGGVPIKEKTDIKELIKESAKFAIVGSNVNCEFDFPEDLWEVIIDRAQMNQVVNNIILNAVEAIQEEGTITIKAENTEIEKRTKIPLKKGKYVKITVNDTGTGIPDNNIPYIFDPFFTTKQRGSGLGLATVFSIIKKHNGFINVESEVGKGTSFYIYLPASLEVKKEKKQEEEKILKCSGKVLIMDDKSFIRKSAERALNLYGFDVSGAEDGEEALNLYKEAMDEGRPYDVVILDLTIPGAMGGLRALNELRKINPKVKAIVSSGYSDDPVMSDHEKFGFNAIIKKPYEYHELSETVKKLLEEE
ncbi:PAS domain S-box protein [candidate division WOR-3 bacterium]|nr:PAS domain S-box protein [candidate division WOR-3 bacterium]